MTKKLLALDQATQVSGYSLWIDGELKRYGTIEAPKHHGLIQRISFITEVVNRMIVEEDISCVILEDTFSSGRGGVGVLKSLTKLLGVLELSCHKRGIEYHVVKATEWRKGKGFGRKRAEQKANALNYVNMIYGVDASEDEAESICIGEFAVGKGW